MKKLALICVLTLIFAFAVSLNCASAQTRSVGVSAGETFKYTFNLDVNMSGNPEYSLPSVFEGVFQQAKELDWTQMTILNVSASEVTVQTLLHFKNGTEQTSVGVTDVETGEGNLTMFLVASNLNANDPIYIGQNQQTINETIEKNYPTGTRQLNHQNVTMDYNLSEDELSGFGLTGLVQHNEENVYWDRQLGVLVELSYDMVTQSPTVNATVMMRVSLVDSNTLTLPEFPSVTPIVLVIAVSAIATALYRKKK